MMSDWIDSMKEVDLTKMDRVFKVHRDRILQPGKRVLRDTEGTRYVYNVDRWMNYSRQKLRVPKTYAVTTNKITPKQMRRMKKKAYKNMDSSITMWDY